MSAPAGPHAVVVGGGIGGLGTALALQRIGWQVTVRERGRILDRGGAGLVLWPNALRCLAALGVEDAVRSRSATLNGSAVRRADGRLLAKVALDPRVAEGRHPLGIVRADLIDVLAAALGPEVLRLGDEVTDLADLDVDPDADPDVDLVVGADGVRSVVRTSMGSALRPEHRGYTVWRALVPAGVMAAGGGPELSETWGAGLRFGMVPAGRDATYVYAAAAAAEGERSDDEVAELRRRFGDWHAPIPAVLEAVEPGTVIRHDIYDLPPGRAPLHRGRRVLVGDAGHAMEPNLGQGAGLALEDAVVLAHALAAEPSVAGALAAYASVRAPRVAALSRQSRHIGRLARLTRPSAVAVRDLAVRSTPDRLARRATSVAAGWRPPLSALQLPTTQETR
jgi:2-polyprenyl-6-methoxyphenol hydroxylase-like FAD-dependent oxidoreductase